jgi:pyridoxal phosphate enzyme (YggS family)
MSTAAVRAGRKPEEIKLVAVSKTHSAQSVAELVGMDQLCFGENRVQEAEDKITLIQGAEWHLIGHLQSNKARRAVKLFDVIQSVDSLELAERLERICSEEGRPQLPMYIQVDLAQETTKTGMLAEELPEAVKTIKDFHHLKLEGLMTIPPFFDDPEKVRPYFARLRHLRDEFVPNGELSMGMSGDFETAIEEGSTLVRVGTSIFGVRDYEKE